MQRAQNISASKFWVYFQTIRPKTLSAALVPFSAGAALAFAQGMIISWSLLVFALFSALCIQIASNIINDAFDFIKDTSNPARLGPKRAIHLGLANGQQMFAWGMAFLLLAFLFAIPLILHGGFIIASVVVLSMLAGYFYTGGPYPLNVHGLGEPFVLIFYGWVATLSGYWLQSHTINLQAILLGTQIGLMCSLIMAIDNYRDIEDDALANKKTLAVRFGPEFAKVQIGFLAFAPFVLNFLWLCWNYLFVALLPLIASPLASFLVVRIWKTRPSRAFNSFLAMSSLLHLCFGILLVGGFILTRWLEKI